MCVKKKNMKEGCWGRITWWKVGGQMEETTHKNFLAEGVGRMTKVVIGMPITEV